MIGHGDNGHFARHRSDAALLDAFMPSVEELADIVLTEGPEDLEEVAALRMGAEIRRKILARVAAGELASNDSEEEA